ncbi:MAG: methyl-accepting chemotaxis protein [Clostridia bacterium]|nr:methyl-accepting chemotaxis protein [Clostridia bacterium]
MRFGFKTIKGRILFVMLPLVILTLILLTLISYTTSKSIIVNEIDNKMGSALNNVILSIEQVFLKHSRIPESLARTVEIQGKKMSADEYQALLKNYVRTNDQTLGAGVWFEPNQYKEDIKYFGPYVYREGDKLVYTEDYCTAEYDYPKWEWYTIGKNAEGKTLWTAPYYDDVSKKTMVTTTVPFYDEQRRFLGVTTGDIDLTNIQKMIAGIRVDVSGRAFLVDTTGMYIAGADAAKIMKSKITEDTNKDLAALGRILLKGQGGTGYFTDAQGKNIAYFAPIPETGWMLVLHIPETQLFKSLDSLLMKQAVTCLIALAFMFLLIILISQYLNGNIRKLLRFAEAIGNQDLTYRIEIKTQDELGRLAGALNHSVSNVRQLLSEISASSQDISASSEELSATIEEISSRMAVINESTKEISYGVQDLSATTQQVNASVEEIDATTQKLAERSGEGSSSSEEIRERAAHIKRRGHQSMQTAQTIYTQNHQKILEAIEKGKVVEEVRIMADSIAGIATQTNLLSLNAAIEAARAGESGKGFAVVAEEIRKLAEQSASAVRSIQQVVKQVQDAFSNLSQNAQELLGFVENNVNQDYRLLIDTGEHYEQDAETINRIAAEIADSTGKMARTMQQINMAVQTVSATAEESASSSAEILSSISETSVALNEIVKASQSQAEQAEKLNAVIQRFKV